MRIYFAYNLNLILRLMKIAICSRSDLLRELIWATVNVTFLFKISAELSNWIGPIFNFSTYFHSFRYDLSRNHISSLFKHGAQLQRCWNSFVEEKNSSPDITRSPRSFLRFRQRLERKFKSAHSISECKKKNRLWVLVKIATRVTSVTWLHVKT